MGRATSRGQQVGGLLTVHNRGSFKWENLLSRWKVGCNTASELHCCPPRSGPAHVETMSKLYMIHCDPSSLQLHSLCYWSRRHSPANLISDWGGQNQSLGRELGLHFTLGQGPCPPHAARGPHAAMDSRPGARTYLDCFTRVSPWFQALHQRQEDKGTSIILVSFPDCCWWSGNGMGNLQPCPEMSKSLFIQ